MKLLFALSGFHRYDRGAEVALLSVASELGKAGDQVTVVGSGPPRPGVDYHFIPVPSTPRERFERFPKFPPLRSETAWEDAVFAARLMRRVPISSFDATITCAFPFTHWALRRQGSSGPAHIFVTQNGDWPAYSDQSEYRYFQCDGLICTNPDYYARNKSRWRTALIPNGVDLAQFRPGCAVRARFGIPEDKPVILMVSAFIDSKRVLDGIRAVAEIDNAFLVIAGDGPLRDEAKRLAHQVLPGRYAQLTLVAHDMPALYRSADVFLHLSLLESFGNVFLEATASGLPVVAHDSERLRWILGDEQFLCDTQEPQELESTLRKALKSHKVAGVSGVERFSWRSIAKQYRQFIQQVVS